MSEPFAFPRNFGEIEYSGLTKREWFAGKALAGVCSNPLIVEKAAMFVKQENMTDSESAGIFAQLAVQVADATLAELAKEKV